MTTPAHACTDPGRWPHPPRSDAPDDDVLAYLDHLEACPYHATLEAERDAPLDALLHEVCHDLPVADLSAVRRAPDRPAGMRLLAGTGRRRVWLAAAVVVILLGVGMAWWQMPTGDPSLADTAAVEGAPVVPGMPVMRVQRGAWYEARVISDDRHGQYTSSGTRYDKDKLTAAAPRLAFGTQLRVINPVNGASVLVTVADRGAPDGRLHLSSSAADSLDISGTTMVIVQIVSEPPPTVIGP